MQFMLALVETGDAAQVDHGLMLLLARLAGWACRNKLHAASRIFQAAAYVVDNIMVRFAGSIFLHIMVAASPFDVHIRENRDGSEDRRRMTADCARCFQP